MGYDDRDNHVGTANCPADPIESRLRELWADETLNVAAIACELGRSKPWVFRHATALGLPNRPHGPRPTVTAEGRKKIRALWDNESLTLAEIGVTLGVSGSTVSFHAEAMGLPPRSTIHPPNNRRQRACPPRPPSQRRVEGKRRLPDLWADRTLTQVAIGKMLGVSPPTVTNWAKELGLPPRPPRQRR